MTWIGQARKRNQTLGLIAYDGGTLAPRRLDLRNAGYLNNIRVTETLNGQYGTAGPTASDQFGILGGYIARLTVISNSVGMLFDTTGEMAALIAAVDRDYARYGTVINIYHQPVWPTGFTQPGTNTAGQNVFVAFGSVGTSAFVDQWGFNVPIALDFDNKASPIGMFQTALNSQETAIELRMRPVNAAAGTPGSGVYVPGGGATGPTPTGNVRFQQIYFDPIADPASQPPLAFIHQWREFQQPLTADGDIDIRLPPSNYYLRVILMIVTGGSGALALDGTHLTRLRWQYGANLAPQDETLDMVMQRQMEDYTFTLPNGCYLLDWIKDARTERDIINSAATTDLRVTLSMSGATYSGGAYVKVGVEQLIPLIVPAPNQAGVQGAASA
jgi:hypothetical protein